MPNVVNNYKCPACGGPLRFDSASGRLTCDYCGTTFSVEEIEKLYAQQQAQAQEAFQQQAAKEEAAAQQAAQAAQQDPGAPNEWDTSHTGSQWGAEAQNLRTYSCPSCGAELICDVNTAATSCPYCGNPTVIPGQFSGSLKPDYVIPFKLDKNAAVAALTQHYQGKRFLPKTFAEANHIQEIQGVYVPFWLYDGVAEADVMFEATRSFSHREGKYEVTTTEHYNVHRAGTLAFEKVPVDASSRMPDDHMDSIEPYDYSEIQPFSTAYLPGFLADKYDIPLEDCAPRADVRCEESTLNALAGTVVGYETVLPLNRNVLLRRGKVHYALLPVWMLSTQWEGQNYLFAMNGQTGKLVGDLPVDRKRFWTMFAAIAAPLAAIIAAALFFLL